MMIVTQLVKEFSGCILHEGSATFLRNPTIETFRSRLYQFHMSNPILEQVISQYSSPVTICLQIKLILSLCRTLSTV
jgi:hypothetical protein